MIPHSIELKGPTTLSQVINILLPTYQLPRDCRSLRFTIFSSLSGQQISRKPKSIPLYCGSTAWKNLQASTCVYRRCLNTLPQAYPRHRQLLMARIPTRNMSKISTSANIQNFPVNSKLKLTSTHALPGGQRSMATRRSHYATSLTIRRSVSC